MQQDERGIGPLIGSVIVIALIVLGGFYFWKESQSKLSADQAMSDELSAIEADMAAASAYSMDGDLQEFDQANAQ